MDGVIVTVGGLVYPVPEVITLMLVTSPENAVIVPVAGVVRVLDTVYVNVVADGSFTEEIIVPTAEAGNNDDTEIVNVVVPVTLTLYVALYPADVPVHPDIVTLCPVI